MGRGWDMFCCISGAMHFRDVRDFVEELEYHLEEGEIPSEILEALLYAEEDVSASQDRIILGYDTDEDLSDNPGALLVRPDVWMIHDVVPQDYQVYVDANGNRDYILEQEWSVVTHYSLVIMRHRFPDFTPQNIYWIIEQNDPREFLGPVARTHDEYVNWLHVAEIDEGSAEEWWLKFLTRSDRTRPQIIQDAWMGPGNMWMFVRPDRFPIQEALAYEPLQEIPAPGHLSDTATALSLDTLPLDVLQEISAYLPIISVLLLPQINKRIRALVVTNLDSIVRTSLERNDRYLLPETPSAAYRSHEEFTWWTERWAEGGIILPNDRIPWAAYARACIRSPSMRNRKRIWDIVGEREANARKLGFLD